MNYDIEYFKLVKKYTTRSITLYLVVMALYICVLVYGIVKQEWIYLILILPTVTVFFAIVNDIKRLNNAELYLDAHKETDDESYLNKN